MRKILLEEKGFTLVELLTVIAIIAILGAVVAPNLFRAVDRSKVSAAVADSRAIKGAAVAYYSDTGEWPPDIDDGSDPGFVGSEVQGWNGPYLDSWPAKNPWNGKYFFRNSNNSPFGENARYLQLDNVPESAVDGLEEHLGEGVVKKNSDHVCILISQD